MMDAKVKDIIVAKTKELMEAPTCSAETREAACRWLESAGTSSEKSETENYIRELEEDIMPVDQLIAFAGFEAGKKYFGPDTAAGIEAHGREIKASGGKYCDCPACLKVSEILEYKDELLK